MAKFDYVAVGPDGRRASGVQKARNRRRAERILHRRELRNIRLTEKRGLLQFEITKAKVKREDIMHLSRQISAFVKAGVPLIEAVRVLADETKSVALQRVLQDVEDGLRKGETLSVCFDRHKTVFPEYYRGILRSAELTGRLDSVMEQLASYLERDLEARRKITSAMTYPMVIVAMALVSVVVLSAFVLPRFQVFFDSLGAELPLPTRILLGITEFVTQWWWAVLGGGAVLTLLTVLFLNTHRGRYLRDRTLLRLPVIGDTVQYALVERFCRVLSSMAGAGVSLPEALQVATESMRNLVFMQSLAQVSEAMIRGEGLSRPLSQTNVFPTTAARMIRVGEETGTLTTQLEFTARYYEGELDHRLKKLTALIEPVIIVVVGVVVGFVAIALVSAMYGVFGQVQA